LHIKIKCAMGSLALHAKHELKSVNKIDTLLSITSLNFFSPRRLAMFDI
jgi:hypothetical protein